MRRSVDSSVRTNKKLFHATSCSAVVNRNSLAPLLAPALLVNQLRGGSHDDLVIRIEGLLATNTVVQHHAIEVAKLVPIQPLFTLREPLLVREDWLSAGVAVCLHLPHLRDGGLHGWRIAASARPISARSSIILRTRRLGRLLLFRQAAPAKPNHYCVSVQPLVGEVGLSFFLRKHLSRPVEAGQARNKSKNLPADPTLTRLLGTARYRGARP
mmetsp:Transcript_36734/g.57409  ORF Transcript_36734/g.57409 Transcript_36734/m.57409 type:complete len:213 (+) Transcript_36734:1693-2331(+)